MKNIQELANIKDQQFIFGSLFTVANKLQTQLDRSLKEFDMTAKQLYLAIAIANLFDEAPTLKETAKTLGYSHQNIKQIALKLEAKGFLTFEKDKNDGRVIRLILTETIGGFWEISEDSGSQFLKDIFSGIDKSEIKMFRKIIGTILFNLYKMEEKNTL